MATNTNANPSLMAADPVLEARIATASDDIEERSSGGISGNVNDLDMGIAGSTAQTIGLRFANLDIPQGAQITAAYIQFTADETSSSAASLLIRGQASDNATPFTNVKFDVSSRPVTSASANWSPAAWTTVGDSGVAERSADISAIVQEIVNRAGWAPSNAMMFSISGSGSRTATSFEGGAAVAPLLHIEYLLPAGGSPVAFDAEADADLAANQIAELAAAGAPVGITAAAHDPDAGDTVSYSIDDARFAIDATSGVITRSATGTLDFETEPTVDLTVTATSSDGSTATRQFTLSVLDSPEPVAFDAPADANVAANTISQGAAAGTAVGITASAKDPDAGSTVTYAVNDARFAIGATSGVITRSATGTLDAATEPTVDLTVTATSSDGSTATQNFAVDVTAGGSPVAFDAPADADLATNQIAELAAAGAPVGITASAHDPDAGSTVSYTIDDPRFTIGSSSGVITRAATGTLDFETEPTVTLTVTATSSDASTAIRQFTLAVLDSPEPVAFDAPADANIAANTIAQGAAAGAPVGITASAHDPDAGSTVTYAVNDARFVIGATSGVITRSGTGALNASSEPTVNLTVTATSSDGSTATHQYSVGVTGAGGGLPATLTHVHTTLTSLWSPPSPDPSGLVYINHLGTMMVSDGEVDEIPNLFTGKAIFEMRPDGTLVNSYSVISFTDEPTDMAYNPTNHHLFFSDDTGTRMIYELDPGTDSFYFTADDKITKFKTGPLGSTDPEGLSYDATRNVLYLSSGVENKIFTISPGANGKFDGVPASGGDDVVTSFDTLPLGIKDPEGVEYDPVHDVLFIPADRHTIAMLTPQGELLATFDISEVQPHKLAAVALGPSSVDPHEVSLYVADRNVDNNNDPNENDGRIYEFLISPVFDFV